jgi:alkylation response protein AidB-like acyl-CoA dehydrogenase
MALVLTEEQELLKESARDYVSENAPVSHLRALRDSEDADGFSRAMWKEVAELGWAGIVFPEAYGGAELGMAELGVLMEECGRTLAPLPILSSVVLGGGAVAAGAGEVLRKEILPGVCSGEKLLALAHQETARFAPYAVSTRATKQKGGDYELTGEKCLVLDGHVADHIAIVARTSGNAGDRDGLSLFLVDAGASGLEVTRTMMVDSRNAALVKLDGVSVSADRLLGEEGHGAEILDKVLDRATAALAAETVGLINEAFDRTVAYLKIREQFGTVIGSFQGLKHRAAEMFCEVELSKSVVLEALRALDEERPDANVLVSAAKARVSDASSLITREAVQLHGGIGMTDEEEIGLFLKRAKAAELTLGDSAYHRDRFASLCGY